MGGRVEQQQLRRAQAEHVTDRRGRLATEERLQHRVQRARPAQHGGGDPVRGGAVARFRGRQGVQRFLEGAVPVQHGGEQVEGAFAGGVGHGGVMARIGGAC